MKYYLSIFQALFVMLCLLTVNIKHSDLSINYIILLAYNIFDLMIFAIRPDYYDWVIRFIKDELNINIQHVILIIFSLIFYNSALAGFVILINSVWIYFNFTVGYALFVVIAIIGWHNKQQRFNT